MAMNKTPGQGRNRQYGNSQQATKKLDQAALQTEKRFRIPAISRRNQAGRILPHCSSGEKHFPAPRPPEIYNFSIVFIEYLKHVDINHVHTKREQLLSRISIKPLANHRTDAPSPRRTPPCFSFPHALAPHLPGRADPPSQAGVVFASGL